MIENKSQYLKYLERLGLSAGQIYIYLASFELGEATVSQLAKYTQTHRVNAYDIVDKLSELGLLEKTSRKRKTFIRATNPKNLIEVADRQRDALSKLKWKIADFVPELEAIYSTSSGMRPRIRYYEGAENYHKIQDETLEEKELWVMGNIDDLYDIIDQDKEKEFIKERVARGIPVKMLLKKENKKSKWFKQLWDDRKKELREIRLLQSHQPFGLKGFMMLSGNKVIWFNSKKELMIVVIESKEIAEMQKNMFQILWHNFSQEL